MIDHVVLCCRSLCELNNYMPSVIDYIHLSMCVSFALVALIMCEQLSDESSGEELPECFITRCELGIKQPSKLQSYVLLYMHYGLLYAVFFVLACQVMKN